MSWSFFLLLAYCCDSFFGMAIVILSYRGAGKKRVAALLSLKDNVLANLSFHMLIQRYAFVYGILVKCYLFLDGTDQSSI
jgi:hypothetical protein